MEVVEQLMLTHDELWHFEQRVRENKDLDPIVAECKHQIDILNQQRHDLKEQTNSLLKTIVGDRSSGVRRSTSILSTFADLLEALMLAHDKMYHMKERLTDSDCEVVTKCSKGVEILDQRVQVLKGEIEELLEGILAGEVRLPERPELKMYNDPKLNKL